MSNLPNYMGALMGLAVGDALGTTIEFKPPGTFKPVTDITGGGPFNLQPGEWTDDTSLALCLAESLITVKDFNKRDQLERYVKWMDTGHNSSNGRCFDIGNTTSYSLNRFKKTGLLDTDLTRDRTAGNGSIMRLAPVPLFYGKAPLKAIEQSGESSKTTHGAKTAVDACRYLGGIIYGAINGATKQELLSDCYSPIPDYWREHMLHPEVMKIAQGSYKDKDPPEIIGSGYVIKSLEAALWAFRNSDSYIEGCLKAVNLGNDADTTGAVYGQIAGSHYGVDKIPQKWVNIIAKKDLILDYAETLWHLAR
jgi:ADP-ribosyl-[dinitrogen reductase] hydrolase